MSTQGPGFFGPHDKPPEPYGKTPEGDGVVKFNPHEPWNVLCPCENCVIPRLSFQRWRYQHGLLTEDPDGQKRTKITTKGGEMRPQGQSDR